MRVTDIAVDSAHKKTSNILFNMSAKLRFKNIFMPQAEAFADVPIVCVSFQCLKVWYEV